MSTASIPAEGVLQLRSAIYQELGSIAEDLASVHREPTGEQHGEWAELVERFDRTRALLDRIGWRTRDPEHDIEIDLDKHKATALTALHEQLDTERHLMDTHEPRQRERATKNARMTEAVLAMLEGAS